MNKYIKKIISIIMVLILCIGMISNNYNTVHAEEEDDDILWREDGELYTGPFARYNDYILVKDREQLIQLLNEDKYVFVAMRYIPTNEWHFPNQGRSVRFEALDNVRDKGRVDPTRQREFQSYYNMYLWNWGSYMGIGLRDNTLDNYYGYATDYAPGIASIEDIRNNIAYGPSRFYGMNKNNPTFYYIDYFIISEVGNDGEDYIKAVSPQIDSNEYRVDISYDSKGTLMVNGTLNTFYLYATNPLAPEYNIGYQDEYTEFYANGSKIWPLNNPDDVSVGYCFANHVSSPKGIYDKVIATDENMIEQEMFDIGYEHPQPIANTLREALITVMYYGYPHDPLDLQTKYNLSDFDFEKVTQFVIWYVSDGIDVTSHGDYWSRPKIINACNELLQQRFDSIEEEYTLNLFISRNRDAQNVVSLRSLTKSSVGGLQIIKKGALPNGVKTFVEGVEFTIYDQNNQAVKTIRTNQIGHAILDMSNDDNGLLPGTYTIRETSAPDFWELSDEEFTVEIKRGEITTRGYSSVTNTEKDLIFENRKKVYGSDDFGGIVVHKTDAWNNNPIAGVVYGIYDANDNLIKKITTDSDGYARTGLAELPFGDYTVKELAATGFWVRGETSVTIQKQYEYVTVEYSNSPKQVSFSLSGKKQISGTNESLAGFIFALKDDKGTEISRTTSDENGNFTFDNVSLNGMDNPGPNSYQIIEIPKDDLNMVYDDHVEYVTVIVEDVEPEQNLQVTIIYDNDGVVFTNTPADKTYLKGYKKWIDPGNEDKRPESITVNLLDQNNTIVNTKTTTAADNWEYSFTIDNLNLFKIENKTVRNVAAINNRIYARTADGAIYYMDIASNAYSWPQDYESISWTLIPEEEIVYNEYELYKSKWTGSQGNHGYHIYIPGQDQPWVYVAQPPENSDGMPSLDDLHPTQVNGETLIEVYESNYQYQVVSGNSNPTKIGKYRIYTGSPTEYKDAVMALNGTLPGSEKLTSDVHSYQYHIEEVNVRNYESISDGMNLINIYKEEEMHPIKISKVDIAGNEIEGAQIQIIDNATQAVVAEWESTNQVHEFELPSGKYIFHEEAAPTGYLAVTDITFEVDEEGNVIVEQIEGKVELKDGVLIITDEDKPYDVTISKVILGQGQELKDAELSVTGKDSHGNDITPIKWISDGTAKSFKLTPGTYTLTEDRAPLGYQIAESINFTVEKDGKIKVNGQEVPKLTMEDKPIEKMQITVSKVWDDDNNRDGIRPESITVTITGSNGYSKTETFTGSHTFTDLDKTDQNGNSITYAINEKEVTDYYKADIKKLSDNHYQFINKHIPGKKNITVNKVWNDVNNKDGFRPQSIEVTLNGSDGSTRKATLSSDNEWSHEFTDLYIKHNGQDIVYTVSEFAQEPYQSQIDGYTITNTYVPEDINVTVNKIWDDSSNQDNARPEQITIRLLANGDEVASHSFTKSDWSNGEETVISATSTIKADALQVEGMNAKSSLSPNGEVNYSVTIDSPLSDKLDELGIDYRYDPSTSLSESFFVFTFDTVNYQSQLDELNAYLAEITLDGHETPVLTIDLEKTSSGNVINELSHTFENLPKYKDGQEIKYTILEDSVDGYNISYNGLTVTNHRTPDKTSYSVSKAWHDNNNQDGIRPDSVKVQLYANDEPVGEAIDLVDTYTWSDLDLNANGQPIEYKASEVEVPQGYTESYEHKHGVTEITNTHTPETVSFEVSKIWDDEDNKYEERPSEIQVIIEGNDGSKHPLELSGDFKGSLSNLPKYHNGQEIVYSLNEVTVEGYEKAEVKLEGNKFTLTNKRIKKEAPVLFSKTSINDTDEIPGATLEIFKGDQMIEQWISTSEKHEVELKPGEYRLVEHVNPENYQIAEDIIFRLNEDLTIEVKDGDEWLAVGEVQMKDAPIETVVEISKQDINGTEELEGATLIVEGKNFLNEEVKEEWISTKQTRKITLLPGTYKLTEITAPDGYGVAESIDFVVDGQGKVVSDYSINGVIVMKDVPTKYEVLISKNSLGGSEIEGATIVVEGQNFKEEWISTTAPHLLKLEAGKYNMTEVVSPVGYEKVTTIIEFEVDKQGKVKLLTETVDHNGKVSLLTDNHIKLENAPIDDGEENENIDYVKVKISKVDATTAKEIPGAHLHIKDTSGKIIANWVSSDKPYEIVLTKGKYVLHEDETPAGYDFAQDIVFTINDDGTVICDSLINGTIIMKDKPIKKNEPALIPQEIKQQTKVVNTGAR